MPRGNDCLFDSLLILPPWRISFTRTRLLRPLLYADSRFSRAAAGVKPHSVAKQYAALAVGIAYAVGIYCEGPYTGGSMNPARTVAAAVVYWDFTGMWISLIFLHFGAIAGAFVYKNAFNITRIDRPRPPKQSEIRYI